MAPAIIGTLFNSERRQTPFLAELDGLVMRALLALPRNEASLAGKNLSLRPKVPTALARFCAARNAARSLSMASATSASAADADFSLQAIRRASASFPSISLAKGTTP